MGNNQENKKCFDKRKLPCYNCEKYGHYSYGRLYGKGIQVKKDEEEAKMAQEDVDYNHVVLIITITNTKSFNS